MATGLFRTALLTAVVCLAGAASAQDAPAGGGQRQGMQGQFAGMQRAGGEVTAISGATLTVKAEDGATTQIVTTDNTRIMKGRGVTIKVADIKSGDVVMAMGNLDAPNKTLHAAMLMDIMDAAQMKAAKDNLGKTYIAGKVTAIDLDNARMTVERPDKVAQVIGFDETTSFKRVRRLPAGLLGGAGIMGGGRGGGGGRQGGGQAGEDSGESITLADIKVGDVVGGQGSLKAGAFVPTILNVSTPTPRGAGRRAGTGANPQPTPGPSSE